jgi:hypothetical protein
LFLLFFETSDFAPQLFRPSEMAALATVTAAPLPARALRAPRRGGGVSVRAAAAPNGGGGTGGGPGGKDALADLRLRGRNFMAVRFLFMSGLSVGLA